jgi:hypothetical protein
MRFPGLALWLSDKLERVSARAPDFVIGPPGNPYMLRWYLLPYNRFTKRIGNVYLHKICRSDDDRALHDHPWASCSFILSGWYIEHTIAAGGVHKQRMMQEGDFTFRRARTAHRLQVPLDDPAWTLFFVGPKIREWGFHCPNGWRHNDDYAVATEQGNMIGRGCD